MDHLNNEQLKKLLQSPESQKILSIMQASNKEVLQQTIHNIQCGNMREAEKQIKAAFNTTDMETLAKELLHKLG